ncbi:glycosyltransferase family 2 protein, partial [Candidatus Poribacteria bacterium]|nr:glycosyltransferase family 2 protein [Candidatus Poribacteria bacterium]
MNVTHKPYLSIIVPVYNEEENVRPLYEKIRSVCESIGKPYEVLFVDDGSQDKTFDVLSEMRDYSPNLSVIRFQENAGQTSAMAAGFEYAQGEYIISMDGDLQNDPADIPQLLEKLDADYDLVCGWRKERQDKFWTRRLPSVVANWIISKVTGVAIHDNGCSLKAYRAEVIKQVPLYGEMHRFIPAMSTVVGARIAEIVVKHHPRRFGTSKYGLGRIWRVFLDILAFKLILSVFAQKPNHNRHPSTEQPLGHQIIPKYNV